MTPNKCTKSSISMVKRISFSRTMATAHLNNFAPIAIMSRKHSLLVVVAFLFAVRIHPAHPVKFDYPPVLRNESVIDNYYGTLVPDPYRHLEDMSSQDVLDFIEAQNNLTAEYLNDPVQNEIREELKKIFDYARFGIQAKRGDTYFTISNEGLQGQSVYSAQQGLDGEPRVVYDPNELSENGTISVSMIEFSPDGTLVAVGLVERGAYWAKLTFRNISTGLDFPDILDNVLFSNLAWSKDGRGVFYARYPENGGVLQDQKIYYHLLGTNQEDDVLIVEFDDPLVVSGFFSMSTDGNYLILFPTTTLSLTMVYVVPLWEGIIDKGTWQSRLIPIVTDELSIYSFVGSNENTVYLKTNDNAPNYKVISVSFSPNGEDLVWSTIIPENATFPLEAAYQMDTDKLVVKYLVDVTTQLEIRSIAQGNLLQKLDIPLGTIYQFSGNALDNEFFVTFFSYLNPGIIYRVDMTQFPYQMEIIKQVVIDGFNPDDYVSNRVFYPSKDGTMIPMFITHKKGLEMNGNSSTILYGYGGFNYVVVQLFQPQHAAFIKNFDGIYAVANIRGGGEYGENWHRDGMLLNKQNTFDDFQAAAEYLIEEWYTSPSHLAINGASNGGLLVSACINQRPDLYAAAVSEVGLSDMLRYQHFTLGHYVCAEYGCSDDGNMTTFENLLRLSPLHNVKLPNGTVQYPATFLTTGLQDENVPPLHSYKYIAELQHVVGRDARQENPLLVTTQLNIAPHSTYPPPVQVGHLPISSVK